MGADSKGGSERLQSQLLKEVAFIQQSTGFGEPAAAAGGGGGGILGNGRRPCWVRPVWRQRQRQPCADEVLGRPCWPT